jgi:NlpC/P60 family/Bacterial dipeptidyl-peptidase Sh3 domain
MMMLDKRVNAFRADVADEKLKGQIAATHYIKPMQMGHPIATLHRAPAHDAPQETQILYGEIVDVFDVVEAWAWVQLKRDNYVGYVRREFLSEYIHRPTHKISVPSTLLYPTASIKTQPIKFLPLNAEISVASVSSDFLELATGGFIFANHAAILSQHNSDFVAVAEQFLNTPYLWGGKSYHGIDCSGLVQTALHACGKTCPRDADMQEQYLGQPIARENLNRGDLIFWQGHVGLMRDKETLLHASGHQMMVVSEPLQVAEDRTKAKGKHITNIKRLT